MAGEFKINSLPGVFSYDRLDEGTRLLIDHLAISTGETALDLGCGYGILGLAIARSGAERVDLVDVNLLATSSAARNISINQAEKAEVFTSDVLSAVRGREYHFIATNPPFHSGKETDTLITEAYFKQSWQALAPGGRLLLVANRFRRYDLWLKPLYRQVTTICETNRYKLIAAFK
jgi:16S rRNA (guanine1207-N2)-methyltransferase